jgi:hypothetical protein
LKNYDNLIENTQSLEEYIQETEKAKQYYEIEAINYELDIQNKIKDNDKLLDNPYNKEEIEY